LSDPKKAKELLGWEAKVDLRSGLEQTKKWIEANPESFQGLQKYRL
jgi:nucleoside-diphosphate-sugar epimerase